MSGELDLMRLHVQALFAHDDSGRITRVNEEGGSRAPRFFLGRTPQGSLARFRDDLEDDLVEELKALRALEVVGEEFQAPPHGVAPYEAALSVHAPIQKSWAGPAFQFPLELPPPVETVFVTSENSAVLCPYFEDWLDDVGAQPFAATVEDGKAVSICTSVRVTPSAHEAGVETHPLYRQRGFARQAVTAWARAVREAGSVALYSTSWSNVGSLALAQSLGLTRFGSDVHFT